MCIETPPVWTVYMLVAYHLVMALEGHVFVTRI